MCLFIVWFLRMKGVEYSLRMRSRTWTLTRIGTLAALLREAKLQHNADDRSFPACSGPVRKQAAT